MPNFCGSSHCLSRQYDDASWPIWALIWGNKLYVELVSVTSNQSISFLVWKPSGLFSTRPQQLPKQQLPVSLSTVLRKWLYGAKHSTCLWWLETQVYCLKSYRFRGWELDHHVLTYFLIINYLHYHSWKILPRSKYTNMLMQGKYLWVNHGWIFINILRFPSFHNVHITSHLKKKYFLCFSMVRCLIEIKSFRWLPYFLIR